MTIASEISRLQNDKEAMRQSIINKGVDVSALVNFDDYASCIDEIKQGGGEEGCIDFILVGGGGAGECNGSGGGGGAVETGTALKVKGVTNITIGEGGRWISTQNCTDGGVSCIGIFRQAFGGFRGGYSMCNGDYSIRTCSILSSSGAGYSTALTTTCYGAQSGGAGAGGNGCCAGYYCGGGTTFYRCRGGDGGIGKCGYGGGGGGWSYTNGCGGVGICGGGCGCSSPTDGSCAKSNATNCGGGGGGHDGGGTCGCEVGRGGDGIAIISFPTDGSYGITSAKGGDCIYCCNGKEYHEFYKSGTFSINGAEAREGDFMICYLAVGGGGGASWYRSGGGGGGAVLEGCTYISSTACVQVGSGGSGVKGQFGCKGGNTYITSSTGRVNVFAGGGGGGSYYGGPNGLGECLGYGHGITTGGTGAGGYATCCNGGPGKCGYGGGGGAYNGVGCDGGGNGSSGSSAVGCPGTTCGSGGGGVSNNNCRGGNGASGLVDICYPADGSWGFSNATGGTKTLIDGYCRHRFTSNGCFCIIS